MNSLYDYFLRGTHKPINKWDHYFEIYERHLRGLTSRGITLVEIGILGGGSLQMWKWYFGRDARIYGVDINADCKAHEEAQIEVFIGDTADRGFCEHVLSRTGPLDVVIDDGGHKASEQLTAFEVLYPAVREGGVYIVEDTHASFWSEFIDTPDKKTFLQFAHEKVLDLHGWTRQQEHWGRFGSNPDNRLQELTVSEFCRTTGSIHFYDSVVAFEKARRREPSHQVRGAG